MAKMLLKDKEALRRKERRYSRGYKDFWFLLLIVAVIWIFELPAIFGLFLSNSREHFHSYGVFISFVSVVGYLTTVLLLALDKRKASIIVSIVSGALILLVCALIYIGYERAINTSSLNVVQIIVSYVIPAVTVPAADIIMVNKRL